MVPFSKGPFLPPKYKLIPFSSQFWTCTHTGQHTQRPKSETRGELYSGTLGTLSINMFICFSCHTGKCSTLLPPPIHIWYSTELLEAMCVPCNHAPLATVIWSRMWHSPRWAKWYILFQQFKLRTGEILLQPLLLSLFQKCGFVRCKFWRGHVYNT